MYIKSGHRFLSDKGQIVFPGPPTRSAFSFSYTPPPTTTPSTTTTVAPPEVLDDDDDESFFGDMWRSKSSSGSDMLSDKIQMFYIYISVTITSVLVLVLLAFFGYMCYKRKGFHSIESQQDVETTRRQSSRRRQSSSRNYSKEREAAENPGQTLLR